jgi:type IV pilus assembly protein PilA
MIVVAIVGILAALAIYGVRRYVANSKTAEARNALGQMSKDAVTAYSKEAMAPDVLALGTSSDVSNKLCPTAKSVPGDSSDLSKRPSIAEVQGKKYQSAPSKWEANGFGCLKFSMTEPQYYAYGYRVDGKLFYMEAGGDLDGDGTASYFAMNGELKTDGTKIVPVVGPTIAETAPEE